MSNRVTTRSKNTTQHPGYLIPKQTRWSSDEVAASRKAKEDAKMEKEKNHLASIKCVANFEKIQTKEDAMERTPRPATKSNWLVCTHSYVDVVHDVEMEDVSAELGSSYESATVEAGEKTDDSMDTEVQELLQRKKVFFFFFSPIH